ncbi:carboxylesterase family protein [Streptomyces sp. SID11385]|uniref:carboxylesterase/lipase family protein n=1 Tax=Streptomyces sp. SID11385 TaxID=2706031 RepID=UPI0013CB951D|nr:carboxylesterase family protein [Streptomyces sp. SID11385]NEA38729.1 carboxylesterase family protein [Streptomyces sp. SID11385]
MTDVRTHLGTVRGVRDGDVHRFLGIPFAAPPVGELRWRHARPPARWEGVRDASAFAPDPIQSANTAHTPQGGQSEDCLYLNVWTTSLDPAARQPVMFWIHGGGFLNGAASMPLYDGTSLAGRGVTVVSVEYRLGAFGFLTDPEAGANFAVTDWVRGLEWVRANAEAFGGDPGRVTVFGQSAGAAATRALLSAPSARGLFHRAIIQSAGFEDYAVVGSPSYERAHAATRRLRSALGCDSVGAMRAVGSEPVRAASLAHSGIFPPEGQVHTPANLVWYPVVDDEVITAGFEGWPEDVPVLLGCTEDEARMFIRPDALYAHPEVRPEDAYTHETLTHMARALGGDAAEDIVRELTGRGLTPYEALAEVCTAAVWLEPALATLDRFAALGRTSYSYRFARVSPGAEKDGTRACHAAENPYVFGRLDREGYYDATDVQVQDAVQTAWTEFARTGVPRHRDGTAWPAYDAGDPRCTVIDAVTTSKPLEISPVTALIRSQRAKAAGEGRGN